MSHLATTRPIFHSEADFQFALAWRLKEQHPAVAIRLEYRIPSSVQRGYVDIWLADCDERVAVELKYKTRALRTEVNGEVFDLLSQSAQDIGRYDTVKDIHRVEQIVTASPHSTGFVLLLTNDSSYWATSRRPDSIDAAFRLHEGRSVTGELTWGLAASAGTRRGREAALLLSGSYLLNWKDYSQVGNGTYGRFRYVLAGVARRP